MGAVTSKSPAERRNTVLRRSQRKSIHGVKGKSDRLVKDIKKFKGIEEDASFVELKARIEAIERDLKQAAKNLQPQLRNIYNDALKKTEQCHQLLNDKLAENQANAPEPPNDDDDEVFEIEETKGEPVQVKVVQVEPIDTSPQLNKRMSLLKVGVPVMPGAILDDLHRRTQDLDSESKVAEIRRNIEGIEMEISQFVGRKDGKYYGKIKGQLDGFVEELKSVQVVDDAVGEQVKMCESYINSCLSFLDEKAVDEESDEDVPDIFKDTFNRPPEGAPNGTMSPKTMRTTYI